MSVLSSGLRSILERAVGDGRAAAEAGAAAALSRLGVMDAASPAYLTADEIDLREGLLARATQLGDPRTSGAVEDAVPLLIGEVAYEQWHRLLFARFLAMNNLLMHPAYGAPVTLEDCEDLAASLSEPDGWSVAARFASQILPGIFRLDDPAVLVRLAPEDRLALEKIVTSLPSEIFTANDALGWVYQYWQSKQKKAVNDSGRKIGSADISPVTQLFTEDYMVRFLLENSLGAWWAARHPHSPLIADWDYLRFDEGGFPAAGSFDGWPASIDQVTVMDPCCGSGHFLVAAFGMLWRMRAEAEGLSPADAQDAVLRENLYALELDPRCTQIAMFNIALEAWKQGGYRELPVPNVACSGIPAKAPLHEWTVLADGDLKLETALTRLHELFKDADTLGSLIDPRRAAEQDDLFAVDWDTVSPLLDQALTNENHTDRAAAVFGHAAAGIAHAAELLTRTYTLIVTNPPYLNVGQQDELLRANLRTSYGDAKGDLSTAFTSRAAQLAVVGGSVGLVTPQSWLSLGSFKKFRNSFLATMTLGVLVRLGSAAFRAISGEVVNVCMFLYTTHQPSTSHSFFGLDLSEFSSPTQKESNLRTAAVLPFNQLDQLQNPDGRVAFRKHSNLPQLSEHSESTQGICTGDIPRFGRMHWELGQIDNGWEPQQSTVSGLIEFGGREGVLRWDNGRGALMKSVTERLGAGREGAWIRGLNFVGLRGVAISQTGRLSATIFEGNLLDNNTAAIVPKNPADLPAIWAYCSSETFSEAVREIDTSLKITNQTLLKVPFDADYWRRVAAERFPVGLPEPFSDDPTQWLFKGVVTGSTEPMQVAVARLLGFSWPDQEPDTLDTLADADGIACLQPIAGEASAGERLRTLLATAYGSDWSTGKLDELLTAAGGKPGDLDGWLRDGVFRHHAKVFQNRPFIWQVWDGRADGFSALINYHRLDRKTLEKLTYTTLGWWIQKQKDDASNDIPGAAARLAAAEQLRTKLELILEGEPPYDIYVRWKSLAEQPIGWDPDLDDGVRMNIRPFVEAGILRTKFTINWNKDRGTNPDGTERHNNLHHTNTQKHQARGEIE
ncbi:SAM-dependent DNA methyltransferase [Agromyces fucosus]|uniref:site-specific DNA-methyltransferase (adenine-specific) n=1 Tax=Agromyces fucosus TaxID=41985 RepID=A0A4Q2JLT9_9MICO|nr:SAM-dependent DNA methyltransferase [Agromyces fucosus]RXZ47569.1 SAM-dependent DNA methyltransferase [Agromyces fucosus]